MAATTGISWCDATFNHVRGCTKVSAGCKNCYAETLSGRNPKTLGVWGPQGTRVVASEAMWREPLKWNRLAAEGRLPDGSPNVGGHRPRVFCASLADVFEDWQGDMHLPNGDVAGREVAGGGSMKLTMQDVRRRLFALIDATPNLDWLLVTKRPENIERMTPQYFVEVPQPCRHPDHFMRPSKDCAACRGSKPPSYRPNVWLGTSVENQAAADERIPHLLRAPAAVRFLSCEPLLSAVDLRPYLGDANEQYQTRSSPAGVGWVIVGCESGPVRRPMSGEWAADLVEQCVGAGVATFVKQVEVGGRVCGDVSQFPSYLAVREFPAAGAVSGPATVEGT